MAGEVQGFSAAAVSRQLAGLEDRLADRLLPRTTRAQALTEVGAAYFARAKAILSDIDEAEALAGRGPVEARGVLRVAAPLSFTVNRLARWLPAFRAAHPGQRLDLDLTDARVDPVAEGIDVALRIAAEPGSAQVISRRIGGVRRVFCAAPGYLSRRGLPRHPRDLVQHDPLCFSHFSGGDAGSFRRGEALEEIRLQPVVHASNGDLLCEMAARGAGVIFEPDFMVASHVVAGRLVPILTDWQGDGFGIHVLDLSRKYLSAKVRPFVDALVRHEGRDPLRG